MDLDPNNGWAAHSKLLKITLVSGVRTYFHTCQSARTRPSLYRHHCNALAIAVGKITPHLLLLLLIQLAREPPLSQQKSYTRPTHRNSTQTGGAIDLPLLSSVYGTFLQSIEIGTLIQITKTVFSISK